MPTLDIDGITNGGDGVGRLDGKAVFVPGVLPGERAEVEITDDRKRFAFGRVSEVVTASAHRQAPPCRFVAEGCGGCDLQHATATHQRELKTRIVREQLQRLGKIADPKVLDCLSVGPDVGYRNRARLHTDSRGRLGFHAVGTHDVVPVDPCLVLAPTAAGVLELARRTEGIAGVEVRGHDRTGKRAMIIEPGTGGLQLPDGDEDVDVLLRQPDGEVLPFRGSGELSEDVAGHHYAFDASCFFQANTDGADALVKAVLAAAGNIDGALTWDLYGGVGLLTLPLAAAGAEVVSVEGHAKSSHWCGVNSDAAGFPVDVRHEAVGKFVKQVEEPDVPDVVVLDPPRVGAGVDIVRALAKAGPETIVYVACDVASLARDVKELGTLGYRLVQAQPLDLFPQTHHVETVATLRR